MSHNRGYALLLTAALAGMAALLVYVVLPHAAARPATEEEYWRRAVREDPGMPGRRFMLGVLLLEKGRSAEAELQFRALLGITPGNASGHLYLAHSLEAQGDLRGARAEVERALACSSSPSQRRGIRAELRRIKERLYPRPDTAPRRRDPFRRT